jgi:hypothetical protein
VVECFLAKEDVAGSTPVSRSNNILILRLAWQYTAHNNQVCHALGESGVCGLRRGTQVVRERSAKPLCVGSIPTRASKFPPIESSKSAGYG